ncbi:phage baseplate assembly protein V [Flavobacterium oreochromis]|uniref:phage baseplate assembly protein V n=1 Tax=Flavobacterium oreochromis TaxID=2906078 RepID=UPI00385CBEE2
MDPPYFNDNIHPNCQEQIAYVVDHNNPIRMGRVRVQFPWQGKKNHPPWIGLTQP